MLGPEINVTTCCTWISRIFWNVHGNFKSLYLQGYWELSEREKVPRSSGRLVCLLLIWSSNTIDHPPISWQSLKNLEYPSIFEISKLWWWTWNFRKTTSKCFWAERNLLLTTSHGETRYILGFQMMEFQHLEFSKIYIFKTWIFIYLSIVLEVQNCRKQRETKTFRNFFPLAQLPITLKLQHFENTWRKC